jgi:hypothetical protein
MVSMPKQETPISKKRRGPKPTGQGVPVLVRLHPPALEALDTWRGAQDDGPSRPEAIRRLVETGLKKG